MTPETLRMSDELLDVIRSGSGQRDTKANELFHALVLLVYEAMDESDTHSIPKRGWWGTPTARAYPLELKNSFLKALLTKYAERGGHDRASLPRRECGVASVSDFWAAFGIVPEALGSGDELAKLQKNTRRSLRDLAQGNQKFLCEQAQVPRDPDVTQDALVKLVFGSAPSNTLIRLREFTQRRVAEIEELFTNRFTDNQRSRRPSNSSGTPASSSRSRRSCCSSTGVTPTSSATRIASGLRGRGPHPSSTSLTESGRPKPPVG